MSNKIGEIKTSKPDVKYKLNPDNTKISSKQLQSLLLNIIISIEQNLYINSLATGWKKEKAQKFLKKNRQIKDITSVHETINFILNEGDRTIYNIILPHFLSSDCKKGRRMRLKEHYMAVGIFIKYSDNLSNCIDLTPSCTSLSLNEADMKRGILAWDMCQLITVVRIAFDAGYLTEQEAWKYVTQAYQHCKYDFDSWEQISKSILIGGSMKLGKKKCFNKFVKAFTLLLNDSESVYNRNHFK